MSDSAEAVETVDASQSATVSVAKTVADTVKTGAEQKSETSPEASSGEMSLDDELSAVYEKMTTDQSEDDAEESDDKGETEAKSDDDASEAEDKADDDKADDNKGEAKSSRAPQSWPAAQRDKFDKLDPDTQEFLLAQDSHMHARSSQMGRQIAAAAPVMEMLKEAEPMFQHHGATSHEGVKQLLTVQRALDTNPVATILDIAERYGATDDLRDMLSAEMDTGSLPPDPIVSRLEAKIAAMQTKIDQQESQRVAHERAAREAQQRQAVARSFDEVSAYSSDKPDFDQLAGDIEAMIPMIDAQNPHWTNQQVLDEAYNRAVWANPATRERQLARQNAEAQAASADAAQRASRAATINVHGQPTSNRQMTDDELLASTYDRMHNRG